MVCRACVRPFIRTKNQIEFDSIKMEFENKMSEFIDGLSEEEFNTKFEEIWLEILRHEALLLHPNEVVKKEHTGDLICSFCSNLKIGG